MSSSGSIGPAPTSSIVEEHINRLSQDLIPLAERCARTMREGAGGSGDAAKRAEPGGRAVAADRDLGLDGLAAS
jgi:hypothetical protein